MSATDEIFHARLQKGSGSLFWIGLIMLIIGVGAIVFPMLSTLVTALLVGWVLLFAGAVSIAGSFSIHGTGPFFAAFLFGALSIAAGVFLLSNPLAGEIALTLLVAVTFTVQGAFELSFALAMRPLHGWVGMLISGLASVLVAVLIAAGWPGVSAVLLGVLLGVNFISTGIAYLAVSRAMKSA